MDQLTTSEEAVIGRSDSTIQFDLRIDDVIPKDSEVVQLYENTNEPKDKNMLKKARSAHVIHHGQQYTFPVFYLNSCPILLTIHVVKVRRERVVANANVVEDGIEAERDLGRWCRLTIVYRYKKLGCVCSSKETSDNSKPSPSCPACRPARFTLQASVSPYKKSEKKEDEDSIALYKCNRKDKPHPHNLKKVAEYEEKKIGNEPEIRFCNNFKSEDSDKEVLAKCRSVNSIIVSTVASMVYIEQKRRTWRTPLIQNVPSPIQVHQKIMRRVMKDSSGRSDFVIEVDKTEIPCHKAILEAHSCVFEKMFSSEMTEKINSKVLIEDMSSDTAKALVEYMYTGQILHFAKDFKATLELLKASRKYCIEELFECCRRLLYFSNFELLNDVETIGELFLFIHQSGLPELKVLETKCFDSFKLRKKELTESAFYMEELMANEILRDLVFQKILSIAQIPI